MTIAALLVALLNAINAGVFLAFTTMVSRSLRETPGDAGASIMRRINDLAPRSVFLLFFLGAPVVAGATLLLAITRGALSAPIVGAVASTVAAFVVSVIWNIPWNNRLERASGNSTVWALFCRAWPRANTARALLSLLAAGLAAGAML